jgi:hypothetical protein
MFIALAPVDISIENDNLEISLYIMKHTENVFKDCSLSEKCSDYLSEKILCNKINISLVKNYKSVWKAFFSQSVEENSEAMPKNVIELENLAQEWFKEAEKYNK